MCRSRLFFLSFVFFIISQCAFAQADFDTSVQVGIEHDTNIYKTFANTDTDQVLRGLFKHEGSYRPSQNTQFRWIYRGGGKVFFEESAQNLFIQYIETPFIYQPSRKLRLSIAPNFKYQNENDALDNDGVDVNEDFYASDARLDLRYSPIRRLAISPFGEFSFFKFLPEDRFSFFRERVGISFQFDLFEMLQTGSHYIYGRQQFQKSSREEVTHEVGASLRYIDVPFIAARYSFQDNNSSDRLLSFNNHKLSLLVSFPLFEESWDEDPKMSLEEPSSLLGVHFLATLQRKRFPAIFGDDPDPLATDEGQRLLLTDAEDDNFSSVVAKITAHPSQWLTIEGKYTYYGNVLTTQEADFRRDLFYLGVRASF